MKYISVCSGIEAASVAWHPLGWEPAAFAEIEPFPCAVLAHHYPDVPNLGDISKVDWRPYHGTVDLVVGGTPCQSFSIAGKREGLDGASGLVFEYFRLLREVQPRWFVWENVPGSFSSNKGADFQSILREWDKCGYHVAWRVLDAQHFGVPQRRRRIFAVGHLGNWRYPAQVLFEPDCLRRNSAKGGKAGKEIAGTLGSRAKSGGGFSTDFECAGGLQVSGWPADKASCLNAHFGDKMGLENQHINQGAPLFVPATQPFTDKADCLYAAYGTKWNGNAASFNGSLFAAKVSGTLAASGAGTERPAGQGNELDFLVTAPTLMRMRVRRLTPSECERLQGFPDDYTLIEYRGKPAPDGPRYKALGNSMAVPCMRWIGERINNIEHQE